MPSIVLKTKYLAYEITENGKNQAFRTADGEDRLISAPAAVIVSEKREEIPSVGASLCDGILALSFADGTEIELAVEEKPEYITFTLRRVSRENFLYVSFLNVSLGEGRGAYEAVMMGMTLATKMQEHPGDNRALIASAYPHIGLLSTARSAYPAKVAFLPRLAPKFAELSARFFPKSRKPRFPDRPLAAPMPTAQKKPRAAIIAY